MRIGRVDSRELNTWLAGVAVGISGQHTLEHGLSRITGHLNVLYELTYHLQLRWIGVHYEELITQPRIKII